MDDKVTLGTEFHVLIECEENILKDLHVTYIDTTMETVPPDIIINNCHKNQQFVYIMSCQHNTILRIMSVVSQVQCSPHKNNSLKHVTMLGVCTVMFDIYLGNCIP